MTYKWLHMDWASEKHADSVSVSAHYPDGTTKVLETHTRPSEVTVERAELEMMVRRNYRMHPSRIAKLKKNTLIDLMAGMGVFVKPDEPGEPKFNGLMYQGRTRMVYDRDTIIKALRGTLFGTKAHPTVLEVATDLPELDDQDRVLLASIIDGTADTFNSDRHLVSIIDKIENQRIMETRP